MKPDRIERRQPVLEKLSSEQAEEAMRAQIEGVLATKHLSGIESSFPNRKTLFSISEDRPTLVYKAKDPTLLTQSSLAIGEGDPEMIQDRAYALMEEYGADLDHPYAPPSLKPFSSEEIEEIATFHAKAHLAFRRTRIYHHTDPATTYEVTWEAVYLTDDTVAKLQKT